MDKAILHSRRISFYFILSKPLIPSLFTAQSYGQVFLSLRVKPMPLPILHRNDSVFNVNDPVIIQMGTRTKPAEGFLFARMIARVPMENCPFNPHL